MSVPGVLGKKRVDLAPLLPPEKHSDGERYGDGRHKDKKAYPVELHKPMRPIHFEGLPSPNFLDCDEDHCNYSTDPCGPA